MYSFYSFDLYTDGASRKCAVKNWKSHQQQQQEKKKQKKNYSPSITETTIVCKTAYIYYTYVKTWSNTRIFMYAHNNNSRLQIPSRRAVTFFLSVLSLRIFYLRIRVLHLDLITCTHWINIINTPRGGRRCRKIIKTSYSRNAFVHTARFWIIM